MGHIVGERTAPGCGWHEAGQLAYQLPRLRPVPAGLDKDYIHNVINHTECYVRGNVHTNGMENFWSLLKRAIKGTYVSVEPFHLFRYLDEQAFRFNNRKKDDGERFLDVLRAVVGKRLTYDMFTGNGQCQTT